MKTNKIFNILVVLALLMAVLPVMVVGAAPVPLLQGSVAAVDSSNLAGAEWSVVLNDNGSVTFNLKPILFAGSAYLQALTVGIVNQAGFSQDLTYGSSDASTPVNKLVLGAGGVYSYTAPAGSLPSGELGVWYMVNGRGPGDGADFQRWIGITPMTTPNDWGWFNLGWANRFKITLPTPTPGIVPVTDTPLFCTRESSKVKINLNDITNLYGYQFQVNYDATIVSASGAFNNSFFDTLGGSTPWNATCSAGTCQFSVSKLGGDPVNGSGTVAEINFTGLQAGEFDVTIGNAILSDRDANVIGNAVGGPLHMTVCGYATATGVVSLQGRATPINSGTVTLTGAFGPYSANFDATTGAWSIPNIKVMPGGTSYTFDAAHGLYLGNQMTHALMPGDTYAAAATKLKGGDADNSRKIDVSDITCISGSFGGAPVTCGTTGSSDINADGSVNILDLVLPGGNYSLTSPQGW
jgi:hypothetical protein